MAADATVPPAYTGMHELDRIDRALATKRLDADLFERCATDFLVEVYPGLSPIPGGTAWGRDADIHGAGNAVAQGWWLLLRAPPTDGATIPSWPWHASR